MCAIAKPATFIVAASLTICRREITEYYPIDKPDRSQKSIQV